ncbi:MAG: hypothetical protein J0I06_24080 [Planctomycetes bacterium]|nr:hypothetical protein [Planctomycetota bacterium]
MPHRTLLVLVLAATALSGGCGTIANVNRPVVAPPNNPDAPVCRIYGGVRSDWDAFWHYPWSNTTPYVDYVAIPLLAVVNLALDGAGDTITLPYTAVESMRRALRRPDASSGYVPIAATAPAQEPVAPAVPPAPAPLPVPRPGPVPAAPPVPPPLPAVPSVSAVPPAPPTAGVPPVVPNRDGK